MLTIGKLAKACDVSVDTVRYYERRDLLDPAKRTASGYRVYGHDAVRRLHFVRRAQAMGFSLEEIHELLNISDRPESECHEVKERALEKINNVNEKIAELEAMRAGLQKLAEFCPGGDRPLSECNILHHFYGDT